MSLSSETNDDELETQKAQWKKKMKDVDKAVSKSWEEGRKYLQPQPEPTEESFTVELLRKEFNKSETSISQWTHAHRLCVIIGHNFHITLKADGTNKVDPPNCWNTDRIFLEDK